VQRDLKRQNVMVTAARCVKILDFGLAKPFGAVRRADTMISTAEMVSADLSI
jgi:serine/threonine protein kinase